jgi:ferredoxin
VKCRKGGRPTNSPGLGTGFTHGEYLAWRRRKRAAVLKEKTHDNAERRDARPRVSLMTKGNASRKRIPVIDRSRCTDCGSCLEICPLVFRKNEETGWIEVMDLAEYPEQEVYEAMAVCPADCINWETA